MKKSTEVEILNEISDACTTSEHRISHPDLYLSFGKLYVSGIENYKSFGQGVDTLLEKYGKDQLSRERFLEILMPLIQEGKLANRKLTPSDVLNLKSQIKASGVRKFHVLREIQGAELAERRKILKLPPFTVFYWDASSKEVLRGKSIDETSLIGGQNQGLHIMCEVTAGDHIKALEIADRLFLKLEHLICFVIGRRPGEFGFGIIRRPGSRLLKHHIYGEDEVFEGVVRKGPFRSVVLDKEINFNKENGYLRLFEILAKERGSLDSKIFLSVEWAAQAIDDLNLASAFIKAATALEILLSGSRNGVISPSITVQISEGCAHLLGESSAECVDIEAAVKYYYGIRSGAVHSGKNKQSEFELISFFSLVKGVIMRVILNPEYARLEKIEDLHKALIAKKYLYKANEPSVSSSI